MSITQAKKNGTALITIAGDSVLAETQEFTRLITDLIRNGERRIIVDLGELAHMNTIWIGTLVACNAKIRANAGCMAVIRVRPNVLQVLKITHLERYLSISDDADAAIAAMDSESK